MAKIMQRLFLCMCVLLPSIASAQTDFYLTSTLSHSRLRYDVDGAVNKLIDRNQLRDELALLTKLGGSYDINTDLYSGSSGLGLGYNITPKIAVELSYRSQRAIFASAYAGIDASYTDSVSYEGDTVQGTVSAGARSTAVASLKASSISLSALYRFDSPLYARLGVEYFKAHIETTVVDTYYARASGSFNAEPGAASTSYKETKTDIDTYRAYIPRFGVGVEFPITKSLSWRAEFEHVGVLKQGFDIYSFSVLYKF